MASPGSGVCQMHIHSCTLSPGTSRQPGPCPQVRPSRWDPRLVPGEAEALHLELTSGSPLYQPLSLLGPGALVHSSTRQGPRESELHRNHTPATCTLRSLPTVVPARVSQALCVPSALRHWLSYSQDWRESRKPQPPSPRLPRSRWAPAPGLLGLVPAASAG